MRGRLALLLFIASIFTAFSQKKSSIDSVNNLTYTYMSNNLQKCKDLFERNIANAKKINYQSGLAKAYRHCSTVHALLGDYKKSMAYNQEALKIYERQNNYPELARTYADLAFRIRYFDYKTAKNYFQKAIKIGEKHKIGGELTAIYNNYSEVIVDEYLDSSIYYAEKSLKNCRKYNDTIGIPFSLNNLAVYYSRKKEFSKAFNCLKESDMYRYRNKDKSGIADNLAYYGDVYFEIPKNDSAIFYYEKSLKMAQEVQYNSLERFCLKQLSALYEKEGNFQKSLATFRRYKILEDSVLNAGVKNELANLQVRYDTEKTKRKLAENEAKLESRKLWLSLSFGMIGTLVLVVFLVYRFQKSKRLNEHRELELSKALEKSKLETDFANEKVRISRELHDNIGSHLTFMISSLDNLDYIDDNERKANKVHDIATFGRGTMKDLRDTIWAMNHDGGNLEELLSRVSELRAVLPESLKIKLRDDFDHCIPLNGLQLLNSYRITQEFIQNTIKYAQAKEIDICFSNNSESFTLDLKDDGKGFRVEEANLGNGILNMKKRCEDLGGIFNLVSSDSGTSISCRIPL